MFLLFSPTHGILGNCKELYDPWPEEYYQIEVEFFCFFPLHWCCQAGAFFFLVQAWPSGYGWAILSLHRNKLFMCHQLRGLIPTSWISFICSTFYASLFEACSQWLHNLSSLLSLIIGSLLISLFSWFIEHLFNTSCTGNIWSLVYVPISFLTPFLHFLGTCVFLSVCYLLILFLVTFLLKLWTCNIYMLGFWVQLFKNSEF